MHKHTKKNTYSMGGYIHTQTQIHTHSDIDICIHPQTNTETHAENTYTLPPSYIQTHTHQNTYAHIHLYIGIKSEHFKDIQTHIYTCRRT